MRHSFYRILSMHDRFFEISLNLYLIKSFHKSVNELEPNSSELLKTLQKVTAHYLTEKSLFIVREIYHEENIKPRQTLKLNINENFWLLPWSDINLVVIPPQ